MSLRSLSNSLPGLSDNLKNFSLIFEIYNDIKTQSTLPSDVQIQAAQGINSPQVAQYLDELQMKLDARNLQKKKVYLIFHS